jgi:hypothetical protein
MNNFEESGKSKGRPASITYSIVEEICDRLGVENNGVFSCKDVRKELGRGSMTTINRHVQTWRQSHPASPDLAGAPSDRFIVAFSTEVKRLTAVQEEKCKAELSAAKEDNEYLYQELGAAEVKIEEVERELQLMHDTIGSQKAFSESLERTNEELKSTIADLQEKRMQDREELGRLSVRLERIPLLEKENEVIKISLERERATNTSLVSDLSVAKTIVAHLQNTSQGQSYSPPRETVASSNLKSGDDQNRSFLNDLSTQPHESQGPNENKAIEGDRQLETILASCIAVITEAEPLTTKELHGILVVRKIIDPEQISVKKLVTHLRCTPIVSFDPASGKWSRNFTQKTSDVSVNGEKHEAT